MWIVPELYYPPTLPPSVLLFKQTNQQSITLLSCVLYWFLLSHYTIITIIIAPFWIRDECQTTFYNCLLFQFQMRPTNETPWPFSFFRRCRWNCCSLLLMAVHSYYCRNCYRRPSTNSIFDLIVVFCTLYHPSSPLYTTPSFPFVRLVVDLWLIDWLIGWLTTLCLFAPVLPHPDNNINTRKLVEWI